MTGEPSVKEKMITLGRAQSENLLLALGPAFSISVKRAAGKAFDVDASFTSKGVEKMRFTSFVELIPKQSQVTIWDLGGGNRAMMYLDGLVANAVVELTTGTPDQQILKEMRIPTRVDIALCQDFFRSAFGFFPGELEKMSGTAVFEQFKPMSVETDPGKLQFSVEQCQYRVLAGEILFQDGQRGGHISLAIPETIFDMSAGGDTANSDPDWSRQLTENVLSSALNLRADLDVLNMPLAQAMAFKPGDVLPISISAPSEMKLRDILGDVRFFARLGQSNGRKAVMLSTQVDPADDGLDLFEPGGEADNHLALGDPLLEETVNASTMMADLPLDDLPLGASPMDIPAAHETDLGVDIADMELPDISLQPLE